MAFLTSCRSSSCPGRSFMRLTSPSDPMYMWSPSLIMDMISSVGSRYCFKNMLTFRAFCRSSMLSDDTWSSPLTAFFFDVVSRPLVLFLTIDPPFIMNWWSELLFVPLIILLWIMGEPGLELGADLGGGWQNHPSKRSKSTLSSTCSLFLVVAKSDQRLWAEQGDDGALSFLVSWLWWWCPWLDDDDVSSELHVLTAIMTLWAGILDQLRDFILALGRGISWIREACGSSSCCRVTSWFSGLRVSLLESWVGRQAVLKVFTLILPLVLLLKLSLLELLTKNGFKGRWGENIGGGGGGGRIILVIDPRRTLSQRVFFFLTQGSLCLSLEALKCAKQNDTSRRSLKITDASAMKESTTRKGRQRKTNGNAKKQRQTDNVVKKSDADALDYDHDVCRPGTVGRLTVALPRSVSSPKVSMTRESNKKESWHRKRMEEKQQIQAKLTSPSFFSWITVTSPTLTSWSSNPRARCEELTVLSLPTCNFSSRKTETTD